jgi:hypothetical protein
MRRVISVEVFSQSTGTWAPIGMKTRYNFTTIDYLATGGDGYITFFKPSVLVCACIRYCLPPSPLSTTHYLPWPSLHPPSRLFPTSSGPPSTLLRFLFTVSDFLQPISSAEVPVLDISISYLKKYSPVSPVVEGRIVRSSGAPLDFTRV